MSPTETSPIPGANAKLEPIDFRVPVPPAPPKALDRVYVWDAVVRSTHWVVAFSLLILAITGIYLGGPYVNTPGEARLGFTTGWFRVLHMYAAVAFTIAVFARLVWMVVRPGWASWRQFIPTTRERIRGVYETLLFYLLIRRRPAESPGHNPLAGLAYFAIFGLYLVMITTGLGLYGASSHVDSPASWFAFLQDWWGGAQTSRNIHHVVTWVLIVFVVQHVASSVITSLVERNGEMDSIFSGFKFLRRKK